MPPELKPVPRGRHLRAEILRLRPGLARFFGHTRRRPLPSEVAIRIEEVDERLSEFNRLTEHVFLPVGGRLMEIQSMARGLAAQLAGMAGELSSDEAFLSSLGGVLARARNDETGRQIATWVNTVRADAKALTSTVCAFGPLVRIFDVLAVITRVESARFVGEEERFVGLASSVLDLSQQIRRQIEVSTASVAVLTQIATEAAAAAGAVAVRHSRNLAPLTEQATQGLEAISRHRVQVAAANTVLSTRFEDVSSAVGDLVSALQTQDIVRQQVEHVQQALRALRSGGRKWCDLPAVARLQAAQLENSRRILSKSVERIAGSLTGIEGSVTQAAGEAARLWGASGQNEPGFFHGVKASLDGALNLLDGNRESERGLAATAVTVQQRVHEIAETITGVRAVGIMMQRIALNATIQAARLGGDGASMEIVANAIQSLASQAEQSSLQTQSLLDGIRSEAASLESVVQPLAETESEIAELRQSVAALDRAEEEAGNGFQSSKELMEELKRRLRSSVEEFTAQPAATEILGWASGVLRGLADDSPAPERDGPEITPANYTMDSERLVHNDLMDRRPPKVKETPSPCTEADSEENVEFF